MPETPVTPPEIPVTPGETPPGEMPDDDYPVISPPIEGETDEVSLDSIRGLFVGKWLETERIESAGTVTASGDRIVEYFPNGTYLPAFIYPSPEVQKVNPLTPMFYKIDAQLLYSYTYSVDDSFNDSFYNYHRYRFYEDKLRIEYVSGLIEDSMLTPVVYIYKRIIAI